MPHDVMARLLSTSTCIRFSSFRGRVKESVAIFQSPRRVSQALIDVVTFEIRIRLQISDRLGFAGQRLADLAGVRHDERAGQRLDGLQRDSLLAGETSRPALPAHVSSATRPISSSIVGSLNGRRKSCAAASPRSVSWQPVLILLSPHQFQHLGQPSGHAAMLFGRLDPNPAGDLRGQRDGDVLSSKDVRVESTSLALRKSTPQRWES